MDLKPRILFERGLNQHNEGGAIVGWGGPSGPNFLFMLNSTLIIMPYVGIGMLCRECAKLREQWVSQVLGGPAYRGIQMFSVMRMSGSDYLNQNDYGYAPSCERMWSLSNPIQSRRLKARFPASELASFFPTPASATNYAMVCIAILPRQKRRITGK